MTIPEDKKLILINRLEMILKNFKNCNGGNDIHEVGQMRQIATMLIGTIRRGIVNQIFVEKQVEILEKRQVEYFKKKFNQRPRV